jgi:hypothetical protein
MMEASQCRAARSNLSGFEWVRIANQARLIRSLEGSVFYQHVHYIVGYVLRNALL